MHELQASLDFCFSITKSLQEMLGVLVSQGCHKKVPHTGWLLNNRNVFSHSAKDYKSEIQVSTGLAPSEGSEGKNLSDDRQSLEFLGFRCITSASASIITCHSPCVHVFTQQSSYKQISHVRLEFHPTQVPLHLKQLTSSMDLFSNKPTLQDAGVKASAYLFRRNSGQYITLGHRKMDTGFRFIQVKNLFSIHSVTAQNIYKPSTLNIK